MRLLGDKHGLFEGRRPQDKTDNNSLIYNQMLGKLFSYKHVKRDVILTTSWS